MTAPDNRAAPVIEPSPERLARALDEAAAKLAALQHARCEPIAVIGLGCRFPGAAAGPDAFWRLLRDGLDATAEVPAARWDPDAWFDPDPDAVGKMYVRRGGFLDEVAGFDARFFEIAPREAASMDPQQRLVLEVAWEALEHAGVAPAALSGSATGVFVGATTTDYGGLLLRQGAATLDAYFSTGNALNAIPGRLAHVLGLQGPCLAVDTACSSSLVAVHLACQSLRGGECDLALAGGVNLMLAPDIAASLCRARMLAPDGRCKTFDAAADGYGRGEGCGVAVLRRLSDALAAGERVLALIRGSAVNQDGASSGFTVPNGRAQEALIRKALEQARVQPAAIDYLEAHGTGTSLGDPIEVRAAAAVLGAGRTPERPLLLGSVKANIGHTEAAAGIAGLIKTVLALEAGFVPPQPHFRTPNPRIPWDELPVAVAAQGRPWPRGGHPRRASVSAFGASGTNAHVVLEEAPVAAPPVAAPVASLPERPLHPLALSARTESALRRLATDYAGYLQTHPDGSWADVCHAANTGRSHHGVRACVVAADAAAARSGLAALARRGPLAPPVGQSPRVAFLFSGQGSQYPGMARQLYATQPGFRRDLDACADLLGESLGRPLPELLCDPDPTVLEDTRYAQPALFALQYALARLWQSWGIRPAAVMGHSVGEYAAACVAGVLKLADGLRLVARRGALMAGLPADGAMAAVAAAADLVRTAIAPHADELAIAAINAPDQTVISGRRRVLEAVIADLAALGIASSPLRVSAAFHSPLLEPMLAGLGQAAGAARLAPPRLPLVSNLSGEMAGAEVAAAGYWVAHARQPVRFADGMATLRRRGCEVFLEIGPARTLLGLGRRCLPDAGLLWLPSLRPDGGDWESLLEGLARLYERGLDPDWRGFDRDYRRARPALPTYPWEREHHWLPTAGHPPTPPAPAGLPDPDLAYEIRWRRADAGAPPLPPDYWPAPTELVRRLGPTLADCAPPDADATYVEVLDALEELCVDYAAQAWERLGWSFAAGTRCPDAELAERLGVIARYRPLLKRTAEMLRESGLLGRRGDDWESAADRAPRGPGERIAALLAQCPAARAELVLLERCGEQLAAVLSGRQDPLPLLFPAHDPIGAANLYGATPGARLMNAAIARALALALETLPAGRRLRVLELGAGTGGTTAGLLELLPAERTDYLFTDLSPHFVATARERFARFHFVQYRLLDIERDPAGQGYGEEAPWDLIVAANVLHATRDLGRTLRHVRALAAPGALLVLLEGTAPSRAVDLIFGLAEGWWRFVGDPLRPRHPLLSVAHWQSALETADFGGVASLALPVRPWGLLARQAAILARASEVGTPLPCWLVLADRDGIGAGLASLHLKRGGETLLAYPGTGFERLGERAVRVAPDRPEELGRLLALLPPGRRCEIVHLWGLDEPAMDAPPAPDSGRLSWVSALHLVQTLTAAPERRPVPRLWLVTRGAVGGQDGAPLPGLAQAPLWGLGRTVAREHPELRTLRLDLDPAADPVDCTAALAAELAAPGAEDETAWRAGVRLVARLTRYSPEAPAAAPTFRPDAAYLIVGGLGGLGLLTAGWMAERGARHLALVGRNAPGPDARAALRALADRNVEVLVRQVDVADYPALERLWSELADRLPPLRGIVHAAGVLDDGLLRHLTPERFERVLRPKVAGAWNLHRLSQGLGLDWLVLYASFTGVLGTPGQANHAAANAFLDALAWHRRGLGLPALSLDWGAWSDIGAAAARGTDLRVEAKGGAALSPAQGLRQLEASWRAAPAQLAVAPVHWDRIEESLAARPLFAELRASAHARPCGAPADLRTRLDGAAPRRRRALLLAQVLAETARVLGLRESETLDPSQGFFALGMDSLTAMELRNRLRTALDCELPSTAAFDYPSPEALTDFLLTRLAPPSAAPAAPAASAAPDRDASDLARLSAAELDLLIDRLAETAR